MTDDLKQRLLEAHVRGNYATKKVTYGEALRRIEQLEAERDELKARIENHQLCEKEPVAWMPNTGPLYRAAIAKGEKND